MHDLRVAGMAPTTFHRHFKAFTSLSPLQYQKRLRLYEAQQFLLRGDGDVNSAAYAVGYQSPQQFNRDNKSQVALRHDARTQHPCAAKRDLRRQQLTASNSFQSSSEASRVQQLGRLFFLFRNIPSFLPSPTIPVNQSSFCDESATNFVDQYALMTSGIRLTPPLFIKTS